MKTRSPKRPNPDADLFLGIVDIILGLVLMAHVATSVAILRIIVGVWFLLRGISLISFSRRVGRSWVLTVGGIITALFGLLIIFNGIFGSMTIIIFIAVAFIFTGILNIWLGFRMRSH